MADRKRPPAVMWIIALFFGLLGFYRVTQSPQFESYRTVDVVQLLASGAGFGVALVGLILWLVPAARLTQSSTELRPKQSGRWGPYRQASPHRPGTAPAPVCAAGAMSSVYRRPAPERKMIMSFSSWLRSRNLPAPAARRRRNALPPAGRLPPAAGSARRSNGAVRLALSNRGHRQ